MFKKGLGLAMIAAVGLGMAGMRWTHTQAAEGPRFLKLPAVRPGGRFVSATQDNQYLYLYYQTDSGVRILQYDVSKIQGLGDDMPLLRVIDVPSEN